MVLPISLDLCWPYCDIVFRFYKQVSHLNQMKNISIAYEKVNPQENIILLNNSLKTKSSCQPKKVIVFHKTHKCSSTTIQNILLR